MTQTNAPTRDGAPDAPRDFKLWGIGTGRTIRPIWTAFELGLERDRDFILEETLTRTPLMETDAFRAVSPRGKIPIFESGPLRIGESAAISLHLADRYRDRSVLAPPLGTTERTVHDELCWFAMTEMDAILYILRRHDGLPEIYGDAPAAVSAARDYFARSSEEIARRLADGRPFLTGDAFTIADLLVKTCLDWSALLYRIPIADVLTAYAARLAERPAFERAMKTNFTPAAMAALSGGAAS